MAARTSCSESGTVIRTRDNVVASADSYQPYGPSASGLAEGLAFRAVSVPLRQRRAASISASVAPLLRAHCSAAGALYFAT